MTTATSAQAVPRSWVALAAVFLAIAAAAGVYLGVSRSLGAHDLPSDSDTLSAVPNVTNAKPLASDPLADDAHIRAIARDEAMAVLKTAARPKPVAPKAEDDADPSATDSTAALNAAAAAGAASPRPAPPRVIYPSTGADPSSTRPVLITPRSSPRAPTTTNPYPPNLSSQY